MPSIASARMLTTLPYLTADVTMISKDISNVLTVPRASLYTSEGFVSSLLWEIIFGSSFGILDKTGVNTVGRKQQGNLRKTQRQTNKSQ